MTTYQSLSVHEKINLKSWARPSASGLAKKFCNSLVDRFIERPFLNEPFIN